MLLQQSDLDLLPHRRTLHPDRLSSFSPARLEYLHLAQEVPAALRQLSERHVVGFQRLAQGGPRSGFMHIDLGPARS